MTSDQSESDRRREENEKFVMIMVILFCTTLAGYAWGGLVSSLYSAPAVGGIAGFLLGVALILTARLAAKK